MIVWCRMIARVRSNNCIGLYCCLQKKKVFFARLTLGAVREKEKYRLWMTVRAFAIVSKATACSEGVSFSIVSYSINFKDIESKGFSD